MGINSLKLWFPGNSLHWSLKRFIFIADTVNFNHVVFYYYLHTPTSTDLYCTFRHLDLYHLTTQDANALTNPLPLCCLRRRSRVQSLFGCCATSDLARERTSTEWLWLTLNKYWGAHIAHCFACLPCLPSSLVLVSFCFFMLLSGWECWSWSWGVEWSKVATGETTSNEWMNETERVCSRPCEPAFESVCNLYYTTICI